MSAGIQEAAALIQVLGLVVVELIGRNHLADDAVRGGRIVAENADLQFAGLVHPFLYQHFAVVAAGQARWHAPAPPGL